LTDERTVAEGDAAPGPAGAAGPTRPLAARRPRRWVLGAGIAAGVLGAGLGLLVALGGDGDDRKAKPSRSEPGLPDPVRVLKRPNAVAVAGGRVWVGGFPNDRLMAIDPGTGGAVDGVAPDVGVGISDMAAGAGGLWATISRERHVVRVDPATGRIAGDPIAVDGTPVAVAAGQRDVWVAVRDPGPGPDGKLLRIDPDRARVTATTPVTAGIVDVVVAGSTVWVLSRKPARVIRFQPGSGRLKPVRLGATEAVSLAYGGGALWATVPDIDSVARVDEKTLDHGLITVGDHPSGVAVLGRDVWVANKGESTLSRIDLATSRAAPDRIAVPLNPFAIATGEGRLWVTCLGARRLQAVPEGFRAPAA
jgi:DNA-binding beta-propeller fold protein YncE